MLEIRPCEPCHLDSLAALFEEARGTIAALGINQWQNGYPSAEVAAEDIAKGRSFGVFDGDALCGTFVLMDHEPTYDRIFDGHWLTGDGKGTYLALHRVAVWVARRGQGVPTAMIDYAVARAKEQGKQSLRIDTHQGNVVMRRMLEKHGFIHCGTIYLLNGDPRVAYEKKILS